MRTQQEVADEIARLEAIRPRLVAEKPKSVLGVDYVAILDAEVQLLHGFLDDTATDLALMNLAIQAYDWLECADDILPSEGWADLLDQGSAS